MTATFIQNLELHQRSSLASDSKGVDVANLLLNVVVLNVVVSLIISVLVIILGPGAWTS